METEETRALVKAYYDTLPKGDANALMAFFDPDIEFVAPASAEGNSAKGAAAVAELFSGSLVKETFDLSQPFKLDVRSMIVDCNTAVVQQRITATAKNGNAYDNQYCWVYECSDGKIVRMEEYADTLLAGRVMGWDLTT